jgi:hypothetical protein
MNDKIETEVGVFADEGRAQAAVQQLEAESVPSERIGIVNDPRRAREVVGTRAVQLVIPMAIVGAVAGIVLLLIVPGQEAYKTGPSGLVPWAIVGAIAGVVVGALVGKVLPAKDPERYQERVSRGEILVTVRVTPTERGRVRRILAASGAENLAEERTGEAP